MYQLKLNINKQHLSQRFHTQVCTLKLEEEMHRNTQMHVCLLRKTVLHKGANWDAPRGHNTHNSEEHNIDAHGIATNDKRKNKKKKSRSKTVNCKFFYVEESEKGKLIN